MLTEIVPAVTEIETDKAIQNSAEHIAWVDSKLALAAADEEPQNSIAEAGPDETGVDEHERTSMEKKPPHRSVVDFKDLSNDKSTVDLKGTNSSKGSHRASVVDFKVN